MGKAPQPTPPKETSAASTSTNVSTAIANAFMQNMNEYTPDGSRTFEQTGTYKMYDPYTGEKYKIPTFDVTTTLSRDQRRIKDAQDKASLGLSQLAADQTGFLQDYMTKPFSYDAGQHEKWAGGLYDRLNRDSLSGAQEAMASRLANQGVSEGSEAYKTAMRDLYAGQQTARDRFMLDAYQTGFQGAQATRNQPINEITALMSGGQVSAPNFQTAPYQSVIPTTNNAEIIANYDQARIDAAKANMGFAGGLFSSVLGVLSDERVKEDKEKVGETKDGIGLYTFKYKGSPTPQFGMMAQEVEKKKPEAVRTGPDGLKRVNYKRAMK